MSRYSQLTDVGAANGLLLEEICRIERNGKFLIAPSEQPLHIIPLKAHVVFYPPHSNRQVKQTFKLVTGKKVSAKILTDKDFDTIARKLGSIIKGRLDSWTLEESVHEEQLFEEAKGTREDS